MRPVSYVLFIRFQSTYLYKVRHIKRGYLTFFFSFNPRTYIRYDYLNVWGWKIVVFQSTYLYKVRPRSDSYIPYKGRFQSTYLYKVRLKENGISRIEQCFNPRTYIRYDFHKPILSFGLLCFNPRTYIRYDSCFYAADNYDKGFQSTYLYKVRHLRSCFQWSSFLVSIHVPI